MFVRASSGGGGGSNVITPIIGGYCASTTGTGTKAYTYYALNDSTAASYADGVITINKSGTYRIGVFIRDISAFTQRLVVGGESIPITATNYYSFIRVLNVNDTVYFNRIDSSGNTSFSLDVDLLS